MSLSIRSATTDVRDVSEIIVRDETNTPRVISEIWVRDEANVPRQVWGRASGGGGRNLTASASPTYVSGSVVRRAVITVNTNQTTVTPEDGVAPFTYSWDGPPDWGISAPNGPTASFSRSCGPGESFNDTFTCTVTDASGAQATAAVEAAVGNYLGG